MRGLGSREAVKAASFLMLRYEAVGHGGNGDFVIERTTMVRKIFTKTFFELSDSDQAAVVRSIIHDLKSCIGRHVDPEDDRATDQGDFSKS